MAFFFFPCTSVFLLSKLWDCFLTPSGCSVSRQSLEHYSSKPLISSRLGRGNIGIDGDQEHVKVLL